jgi:ABC-type multidrug transport system fused ATPase/permease subunit
MKDRRLPKDLIDAMEQLTFRQRWSLVVLTIGKVAIGVMDLGLALLLYRYFLLLKGGSNPSGQSFLGSYYDLKTTAVILLVGFSVRMAADAVIIRSSNGYRQALYAHFFQMLTDAYMTMNWLAYIGRNKNDLIKYCMTTTQDCAYAYQLLSDLTASTCIVLVLAIGCFKLGVISAICVLASLAALLVIHRFFFRTRLRQASDARNNALKSLSIWLGEMFSSAREIHVYRNFERFRDRLVSSLRILTVSNERLSSIPELSRSFIEQGAMIFFILMMLAASRRNADTTHIVSIIVFYFILVRRMLPALSQVFMVLGQLNGAFQNINLVRSELSSASRNRQAQYVNVAPLKNLILELRNVSFSYVEDVNIVDEMSFSLSSGSLLVVRGPSGGGKSTLVNLVAGLMQPDNGEILVDRSRIAVVPQEVTMLDDSIRANILFGLNEIPTEELELALETAQLQEFVRSLPNGLDTMVGENGILLSGGQRQRLGVARAMVRKPTLLLLDEATSALDAYTEDKLLTAVVCAMSAGAILLVTHRYPPSLHGANSITIAGKMSLSIAANA